MHYARKLAHVIIFGLCWWCQAGAAHAATPVSVLLVCEPSARATRLHDELAALGILVTSPPTAGSAELAWKNRGHAAAMVEATPAEAWIRVWLPDGSGAASVTNVTIADADPELAEKLLVARTVELIRVSLMTLPGELPRKTADEPRRSTPAPPRSRTLPAPPVWPRRSLATGVSALYSAGGYGFGLSWLLSAAYQGDLWGARAFLSLPFAPHRLRAAEGDVTLAMGMGGIGAQLCPRLGKVRPLCLGADLAAVWARMQGEAQPPLIGRESAVWGALAQLRSELGVAVGGPISLHAEGTGGYALAAPVPVLADRRAAAWGRPLVGIALKAAASW